MECNCSYFESSRSTQLKALFTSVATLVTLLGCASYVDPIEPEQVRDTLEVGVSNKAEANALLGFPTAIYKDGSQQLYTLNKETLVLIPASHVGIGTFSRKQRNFVFLDFDDNGILRSFDIEKTKFVRAGPVKTKVPLANAFGTETEDILDAHVVSWYSSEQGCSTLAFWNRWDWDNARDTQAALALGLDFVGIAEWQNDERYDVKWVAKNVDLVSVFLDSFGVNKCVVLEARDLPSVTFSIPNESVWLNTDRKAVDSVSGDLMKRVPSQ